MKKYVPQDEQEAAYLAAYNPDKWKKPSVTADMAVFAYENKKLYLLLVERGGYPYRGCYALPGGFADMQEGLIDTARRELEEETGLCGLCLEQVSAWGTPGRDPRDRTVSVLYTALADKQKVHPQAGDDAKKAEWFCLEDYREIVTGDADTKVIERTMILQGSTTLCLKTKQTVRYGEYKQTELAIVEDEGMSFDHAACILDAYAALRLKLMTSDFAYDVLGRKPELEKMQALYETIFFRPFTEEELQNLPYPV